MSVRAAEETEWASGVVGRDMLFDGNQGQTGGGMCVESSIVAFLTDT